MKLPHLIGPNGEDLGIFAGPNAGFVQVGQTIVAVRYDIAPNVFFAGANCTGQIYIPDPDPMGIPFGRWAGFVSPELGTILQVKSRGYFMVMSQMLGKMCRVASVGNTVLYAVSDTGIPGTTFDPSQMHAELH